MREILFRGKQIDTGAWVEGAFCMKDCDDPFGELVDRPSIIKYEEPHSGYWFRVDPETVGQFTGLTDKNGKKIFEGDIVKAIRICNQEVWIDYVVMWKGCFALQDAKTRNVPAIDLFNVYEVIGNIHDNPELLEVEDG